jgi:sensor histidine kinase regulating citrate/malate metabolism
LTYPDPFEQGGSPMRRWLPRTLAGKFLVLQLVVVALVLVVAAVVSARQSQAQFRTSAADRILGAAENLAANPAVRERIDAPSAASDLAPIVESARIQSGTSVVVIADARPASSPGRPSS